MKTLILLLLTAYQNYISPLFHQLVGQRTLCRSSLTCSNYAKEVISKYGAFRGSLMAIDRFLHCQPFIKPYANF